MDSKFYREIISLEAKQQGHGDLDDLEIDNILEQLEKANGYNISYDQVEDSYETM